MENDMYLEISALFSWLSVVCCIDYCSIEYIIKNYSDKPDFLML